MFSSAAGLTCAIDADQYPAACVLQLAWCGWLWLVVGFNTLVGSARLLQGLKGRHALLWGSLQGVVRNEGANPPLVGPVGLGDTF